ncbi:hypothetical protein IFM89_038284 [Coptis chinensis]|uniref:MORF/ORRM1/DAG-like MORF domain-containing protein n=1 Tax=Coptis chinensis TaxID=261450 RepID=A0A835H331_9MAGN|nr:hypothetical protein IFM89_038284 [Coptis chinensis]
MILSSQTLYLEPQNGDLEHLFSKPRQNPTHSSKPSSFWFNSNPIFSACHSVSSTRTCVRTAAAAIDSNYSSKRSSNSSEPRETILLPGCDYNHWLIVMEFPKDPAPTREQMIDTYLNTLSTVVGSMEEAKKNMYAFSTTTYTGFQCTDCLEFWVLPDSCIDVKNKDYGGDKYINGEIIPGNYPTYQPKTQSGSKYERKRYERRRDGPPAQRKPKEEKSTEA